MPGPARVLLVLLTSELLADTGHSLTHARTDDVYDGHVTGRRGAGRRRAAPVDQRRCGPRTGAVPFKPRIREVEVLS